MARLATYNTCQYILGFGMTLRARGFMTDNILEGYRDPYNRDGDAYGLPIIPLEPRREELALWLQVMVTITVCLISATL